MTTLKSQIEKQVSDFNPFQREANQECTIIERKMAPNGCGSEFLLVDFISSGHPYDAKGVTVIVITEDYIEEIDRQYVKSIFNR
jgi:hypothetical protein